MAQAFYNKRARDYCQSDRLSVTSVQNNGTERGKPRRAARLSQGPTAPLPSPGPCSPSPAPLQQDPTSGSGRKASASHCKQETRETLILEKSYTVQTYTSYVKMQYFLIAATCSSSHLSAFKATVIRYF